MLSEEQIKTMSKVAIEKQIEINKRLITLAVGTLYPQILRTENRLLREELMTRK
jgi:hypothetical protein